MALDLTILIPTFDRPCEVSQRLREIYQQFGADVPVVVQVNPGEYAASDICIEYSFESLCIRENAANIGFVANIVAGMFAVNTEWVWILGDDDSINPCSKDLINSSIELSIKKNAQLIVFNQWRLPQDGKSNLCQDIDGFVGATAFSDCLFISALVWRASFLRENLGTLIDYSFTRASQAVIQLSSLAGGRSKVLVRNSRLVNYRPAHRWSRIDYLQRVDKVFLDARIGLYHSQVFAFMFPQISWAMESALEEVTDLRNLGTWIVLFLNYTAQVLREMGPSHAFKFARTYVRPLLRSTIAMARRYLSRC